MTTVASKKKSPKMLFERSIFDASKLPKEIIDYKEEQTKDTTKFWFLYQRNPISDYLFIKDLHSSKHIEINAIVPYIQILGIIELKSNGNMRLFGWRTFSSGHPVKKIGDKTYKCILPNSWHDNRICWGNLAPAPKADQNPLEFFLSLVDRYFSTDYTQTDGALLPEITGRRFEDWPERSLDEIKKLYDTLPGNTVATITHNNIAEGCWADTKDGYKSI